MRPGKSMDPVNWGTVNRGFTVRLNGFILSECSTSKSKKKGKPLKFDVIIDAGEFLDSPDQFYMWKYSPMGIWAYIIGTYLSLFGYHNT